MLDINAAFARLGQSTKVSEGLRENRIPAQIDSTNNEGRADSFAKQLRESTHPSPLSQEQEISEKRPPSRTDNQDVHHETSQNRRFPNSYRRESEIEQSVQEEANSTETSETPVPEAGKTWEMRPNRDLQTARTSSENLDPATQMGPSPTSSGLAPSIELPAEKPNQGNMTQEGVNTPELSEQMIAKLHGNPLDDTLASEPWPENPKPGLNFTPLEKADTGHSKTLANTDEMLALARQQDEQERDFKLNNAGDFGFFTFPMNQELAGTPNSASLPSDSEKGFLLTRIMHEKLGLASQNPFASLDPSPHFGAEALPPVDPHVVAFPETAALMHNGSAPSANDIADKMMSRSLQTGVPESSMANGTNSSAELSKLAGAFDRASIQMEALDPKQGPNFSSLERGAHDAKTAWTQQFPHLTKDSNFVPQTLQMNQMNQAYQRMMNAGSQMSASETGNTINDPGETLAKSDSTPFQKSEISGQFSKTDPLGSLLNRGSNDHGLRSAHSQAASPTGAHSNSESKGLTRDSSGTGAQQLQTLTGIHARNDASGKIRTPASAPAAREGDIEALTKSLRNEALDKARILAEGQRASGRATVQLEDSVLGRVNMDFTVNPNKGLQVEIITSSPDLRQALEASADSLREGLENQSFKQVEMSFKSESTTNPSHSGERRDGNPQQSRGENLGTGSQSSDASGGGQQSSSNERQSKASSFMGSTNENASTRHVSAQQGNRDVHIVNRNAKGRLDVQA